MREAGHRPVQVWVPDVRTESFAAEAYRQSVTVSALHDGTQEFIEAISEPWKDE